MRKYIVILFLVLVPSASASSYMLGMRNSKYAFAAYENTQHWGIAFENSVFVEEVELQYARAAVFYAFNLPLRIDGAYSLYYGRRYNGDFYDVGSMLKLKWNIVNRLFEIGLTYQPFYDSDLEVNHAYNVWFQSIPLEEVGIFMGLKNQADYRDLEKRAYLGIVFDTPHVKLRPEVSTPLKSGCKSTTRVTINFIYRTEI